MCVVLGARPPWPMSRADTPHGQVRGRTVWAFPGTQGECRGALHICVAPIVLSSLCPCLLALYCAVTTDRYRTSDLPCNTSASHSQRRRVWLWFRCECRSWRMLVAWTSWTRSSPESTGIGAFDGFSKWQHAAKLAHGDLFLFFLGRDVCPMI